MNIIKIEKSILSQLLSVNKVEFFRLVYGTGIMLINIIFILIIIDTVLIA